ncbi:hypothetical protein TNCV_494381 [Trichonephila clavipes]|nr:hypothetical protein TNCV_494381 [Trichonephila clavipes]
MFLYIVEGYLESLPLKATLSFDGEYPKGESGASHLSSHSTNFMRGHAAPPLFRVPPCRNGTTHSQISMSSPGFEPRPSGTAVSVANHYTGWA